MAEEKKKPEVKQEAGMEKDSKEQQALPKEIESGFEESIKKEEIQEDGKVTTEKPQETVDEEASLAEMEAKVKEEKKETDSGIKKEVDKKAEEAVVEGEMSDDSGTGDVKEKSTSPSPDSAKVEVGKQEVDSKIEKKEEVKMPEVDVKEEVFRPDPGRDKEIETKIDGMISQELRDMNQRALHKYLFVGFGVLLVVVWAAMTWMQFFN